MAMFGFGKRPQPRTFDYVPRYYSPEEEDLKRRLGRYRTDTEQGVVHTELVKSRIRGSFRRNSRSNTQEYKAASRKSSYRLLLVLACLLLLTAYFITNYLPRIVAALE